MARLVSSGAPVRLVLETGDEVTGQIEWVDAAAIKVRRRDAAAVLVMKRAVVSLQAGSLRHEP